MTKLEDQDANIRGRQDRANENRALGEGDKEDKVICVQAEVCTRTSP